MADMMKFLGTGKSVLTDEIRELKNMASILDERFEIACDMVMNCQGRVIFTGVGHSDM